MQISTTNASRHAEFAGGFDSVCAGSALQSSKQGASGRARIFDAAFTMSISAATISRSALRVFAASGEFGSMQRKRWIFQGAQHVASRLHLASP
jgi:hypothetical protein